MPESKDIHNCSVNVETADVTCYHCGDPVGVVPLGWEGDFQDLYCEKCHELAETDSFAEGYEEAKDEVEEVLEDLAQELCGCEASKLSAADVARHPGLKHAADVFQKRVPPPAGERRLT